MKQSWEDIRPAFQRVAFKRGVDEVAQAIPADRATVYRILSGETRRPSRAVQEGVRRVVEEEQN